ncbi:MAG: NfeD family protein [Chloroflexota bacterium]|nr:NfeD family protein [Chloroflexota bacterium]
MVDILLNPNVAYIFLIGGFSLALMAILTPGTGFLEIGALFALLLAGWGIYSLEVNYWALAIMLLGVVPFIWAVRKSGGTIFLGITILALIVGSAFLFRSDTWWKPAVNPVLTTVASLLFGGFFWIAATKILEADAIPLAHDLGSMVGAIGEAKTEIYQEGSAQVRGELWSARSENPIPIGAVVRVIRREGFVLEIEEIE